MTEQESRENTSPPIDLMLPYHRFCKAAMDFHSFLMQTVEERQKTELHLWAKGMLERLALLYSASLLILQHSYRAEDFWGQCIEPKMTETEYEQLRELLSAFLAEEDSFLDFEIEDARFSDCGVAVSVSELLMDIEQHIADYLINLKQYPEEENLEHFTQDILQNFYADWGLKTTLAMRWLHELSKREY